MKIIERISEQNYNIHISLIKHNIEEKKDLYLVEYWDTRKDWIGSLSGVTKQELHDKKLAIQEKINLIKIEMKKDAPYFYYYKEKLEKNKKILSELNKHGAYAIWLNKENFDKHFEIID